MSEAEHITRDNPIKNIPPEKLNRAGRPKGSVGPKQRILKTALMMAAEVAGNRVKPDGEDGLVEYLAWAALDSPGPFLSLLGRVLPMQVEGTGQDGSLTIRWLPPSEPPTIDHEGAEDV